MNITIHLDDSEASQALKDYVANKGLSFSPKHYSVSTDNTNNIVYANALPPLPKTSDRLFRGLREVIRKFAASE